MNILFITSQPYLPQLYGGSQRSTDQVCQSLVHRGHAVAVLAGIKHGGVFALIHRLKMHVNKYLCGHKIARDKKFGYPIWRSWIPWEMVSYVAQQESADLIVVISGWTVRMALAAKSTGVPLLIQIQDVNFSGHGGDLRSLGKVASIANSHFSARIYRNTTSLDPVVVYPFIQPEKYRVLSSRKNVTFINPVPEKGRDIALEVARRCPDIPFTFVLGWPLSLDDRALLDKKISVLPNVSLVNSQTDMRCVYASCKILLVPSLWEEAYGRVVTESQFSGIPVVASTRGGLPEAVGPGGILLDPDGPLEDWVKAVHRLWHDDAYYSGLSDAALAYAERPESSTSYKIDMWEKTLLSAIHEHKCQSRFEV